MAILPVTNVINVSVTATAQGLTVKNVNSLALFTNDVPINPVSFGAYGIYVSAAQVAADFGTSSVTAAMANAIFAQSPNLRTGTGRLVIIPLQGSVSATPGQITTANISANLTALAAVTSGYLKVTVNGTAYNLSGLNFSGVTTFAQAAAVIDAALPAANVIATANGLQFISNKVGTTSTVALASVSGGTGTDLSATGYFNAAGATATGGANSSGETLLAAVARMTGTVGFVPFMTNLNLEDAALVATATGVQALDNLFFHHLGSVQDIAGVATTIQQAGNYKTRLLFYSTGTADANLYKAAYAGRACSTDFTGSNTSTTLNLKQLATITPDPGMTQTLYTQCNTAGCDPYISIDGVPGIFSTQGNLYFDQPYSRLALKFALESNGFNYLQGTNTKVPQTEQGMNGLKSAYMKVCDQFVRNGYLAPGQWTSSETFGDPVTFNANITNTGYYMYNYPVALQNSSDRTARIAPLVQIAVKEAGAIQHGDVTVVVNP